jgi:hypothetical protein
MKQVRERARQRHRTQCIIASQCTRISQSNCLLYPSYCCTLFLTIFFSRTSPFSVELCIAERQLDFAGVWIFRFMTFFDVAEILL